MNQETYVKIEELKKQGWTNKEIAEETGFHPATIAKHLAGGGPPVRRAVPDETLVMNQHWQDRVDQLITKWPRLLGISVFHRLRSEGFGGGYSTVTR
jgi:lambda repressor-like predicted transcriptional regulator